jgi:hypothetical protein
MTTLEEQVDELVAMAADAGRLGAEHAAAEKARETALDRRRAGARARAAREEWERAERRLNSARARFLARYVKVRP